MKRLSLPVAVLGLLLQAGGQAMAGPVLDFTGGTVTGLPDVGETVGWQFTVTSPITVSALGVFDPAPSGFGEFQGSPDSFPLGLWTSGGTLLASATITDANSTPVASTSAFGDWRFTPIGPLTLVPGDYVVGAAILAFDPNVGIVDLTNTPSTIAGVTFGVARLQPGGLIFPSGIDAAHSPGFFGPNLFVGALAVATPEPSTLLLLGSGLAGLAGVVWRRSRRT